MLLCQSIYEPQRYQENCQDHRIAIADDVTTIHVETGGCDTAMNRALVNPAIEGDDQEKRRVDFDLQGIIGVRLINPSREDVACLQRQIGPLQTTLTRNPDVVLRFVPRLEPERFRHLGFKQKGFTDDAFFLFEDSPQKKRMMIPFDRVGGPCEIVCENGIRSFSLLMPMLSMTALAKGFVTLHASAVTYRGTGILMAGWSECGKTTAMLGLASKAAEFIGDEWVLLDGDGRKMYGLPAEIELSFSQMESLPHTRRAVSGSWRWLFEGVRILNGVKKFVSENGASRTRAGRAFCRAVSAIEGRVAPRVTPQAVFLSPLGTRVAEPEKVFLLVSHDDPCVEVERTPSAEMARRLAHLVYYEQMKFMQRYTAYKFAFPSKRNELIENSATLQLELLASALRGKETYTVWHPYPLDFSAFYEKIAPLSEKKRPLSPEVVYTRPSSLSRGTQSACKQ